MNNKLIERTQKIFNNPIIISGLIVLILTLILLYGCNFQLPPFYTDRELADQIAQSVTPEEVDGAVAHLINPKYFVFNKIFKLWGLFIAFFAFTAIFKITEFKKFRNIRILTRKAFIYPWINLSFPIWGFCYVNAYMTDIVKYVYNWAADSFGIPLFSAVCFIIFIGIIYYPVINLLSFVTFNTKIKRWIYSVFWITCFIFWFIMSTDHINSIFTYYDPILFLFYLIWFVFIIYAVGYMKNKPDSEKNDIIKTNP